MLEALMGVVALCWWWAGRRARRKPVSPVGERLLRADVARLQAQLEAEKERHRRTQRYLMEAWTWRKAAEKSIAEYRERIEIFQSRIAVKCAGETLDVQPPVQADWFARHRN